MIASKSSMLAVVTLALVVLADAAVFRRSNDDFNWKMQDLKRRAHERRNLAEISGSEEEDADETKATSDDKRRLLQFLTNNTWETRANDIEPTPSFGPVIIGFGLALNSIQYDAETGIGKASVWEKFVWEDNRYTWDPSEFGGLDFVRMEPYYVWTPDFTLYNSLTPYTQRSWNNLLVFSDGTVLWIPRAVYETFCEGNEQGVTCFYKVGPWTYDANTVDVAVYGTTDLEDGEWATDKGVDVSEFDERCGARIISSRARVQQQTYECCDEPYSSFEAEVTFTPRQKGNRY